MEDIDNCKPDEARERCKAAGPPEPSGIVASGNGAHLYWFLSEPYLIDDVGTPPPVFTDFIDQGDGKKKKRRKYLKGADGKKSTSTARTNATSPRSFPRPCTSKTFWPNRHQDRR